MSARIARWTTVKLAHLRARYPNAKASEIAVELGFTTRQVQSQAIALGLSKKPTWTAFEDQLVCGFYSDLGSKRLSKLMQRTPKAILARAQILGAARRRVRLLKIGRAKWPEFLVQRARLLHSRKLGYANIALVLADEFTPAPSWHTVRDWCAMRTRYAA